MLTLVNSINLDMKSAMINLPNEEAVQQLASSLADARDLAANDLQKNVFKNYTEFVVIGKEISKVI